MRWFRLMAPFVDGESLERVSCSPCPDDFVPGGVPHLRMVAQPEPAVSESRLDEIGWPNFVAWRAVASI